jgi:hypothetical protein
MPFIPIFENRNSVRSPRQPHEQHSGYGMWLALLVQFSRIEIGCKGVHHFDAGIKLARVQVFR